MQLLEYVTEFYRQFPSFANPFDSAVISPEGFLYASHSPQFQNSMDVGVKIVLLFIYDKPPDTKNPVKKAKSLLPKNGNYSLVNRQEAWLT